MNDKRLKDSWENIEPDRLASKRMKQQIFIEHRKRKVRIAITLYVTASLSLFILFLFAIVSDEKEVARMTDEEFDQLPETSPEVMRFEFHPINSDISIKVKPTENPILNHSEESLIYLTEEELLSDEVLGLELAAFHGRVVAIHNLDVEFKQTTDYFSVVEFEVFQDLRTDIELGSIVTIRMPGHILTEGSNNTVMDTAGLLEVGTHAVIMPLTYDETSIYSVGDETLYLNEIAEYGVGDGRRYIFIETVEEIIFANEAYPSFKSMDTLEEVAEKIRNQE